jgi:hypothetical protein
MTMRTSRKTVTFRRPFSLSGLDEMQPAGTYTVETNEELLEGLSFPAWRRTATVILLRPQAGGVGLGQDLEVDPLELAAVADSDALNLPAAVGEATLGDLLADGVLQQAVRSAGLSPAAFKTLLRELTTRILAARLARESGARLPLAS